ncbi:uncharacterized protein LOC126834208 [Adelges cooleyi]|uniref:uncharacterized protein LOC126834208 n=1 Tax=Adelges cooleyi TaxID=133065 RepID=UPI00217F7275|nr:uncharacterized protein LOC126834208 [Adelges cooleyi]
MSNNESTFSLNVYQGGGHFEFSSEKNWGIVDDDCTCFDSIDFTHLSDSIASVPFHIRHNIPQELFTVDQLEEFEVEASLANSRHTFQCNSKSKDKFILDKEKSLEPETKKLLSVLTDFSLEDKHNYLVNENEAHGLEAILGNTKPLLSQLKDEHFANSNVNERGNEVVESTTENSEAEKEISQSTSSGHWLNSMLEFDDE